MPSGQDFVSRLREETRRTVSQHLAKFVEEFRALQDNFSTSISSINQLAQRLGSIDGFDNTAAEAVLTEALDGVARREATRRDEETSFLAHFAHDLRRKETQEEILNSLLDGAQRYAPRLVLFVTRGSQFVEWSSRGFSGQAAQQMSGLTLPSTESSLLRSALQADGLTTANSAAEEKALAQFLPEGMEGPWHAFPLKAIQRPVAVLLAAAANGTACNLEALCILMDLTGLCVENMALRLLCQLKMTRPPKRRETLEEDAKAAETSPAAAVDEGDSAGVLTDQSASGEGGVSVPPAPLEEAAPETVPAFESAASMRVLPMEPQADTFEPAAPDLAAAVAAMQPEVPHAAAAAPAADAQEGEAPTAEALITEADTAEVPAPEVAALETPGAGEERPEPEPARPVALREVQPLSEEEKIHADAKRFARLLASEIKLYNEQRVEEGRLNRDIYVRLKRDIDRSRDMYEKRVSPLVSRKVDYFHDELIRVLGDNDPSTLGSDYPGPRVES